ncbi:hypothetical protein [Sandarakinorhabdus sp.]|uniref:hypothetical protein n=1 Tax=Sandarakinorhabdus sp. TaxID=1916663 RepID=UPI00286DE1DC|nr:hypothetical protein [Sandarakinorhabdus sp.]
MAISDGSLSASSVQIGLLIFADFADLPIRAAYAPCPLTVPAGLTDGDADCWGLTFDTINADVLRISPVEHSQGGTGTLSIELHTDAAFPALLNAIENPALYLGRRLRLWQVIFSLNGQVLEIQPLARLYMTVPRHRASSSEYLVVMEAENFSALIANAPARTYLNSTLWDAGDLSGIASQGVNTAPAVVPGGGGGRPFGTSEFVRLV